MHNIVCNTYKICVNRLLILITGKASGQQRLLAEVFGESQVRCGFSAVLGVGAPNPHVFQGSTVVPNSIRSPPLFFLIL